MDSLHQILEQLTQEPGSITDPPFTDSKSVPLRGVLDDSLESLRNLGFEVKEQVDEVGTECISSVIAEGIGEIFVNVMKHGQSPVRILLEVSDERGRLLVVNGHSETAPVVGGTGLGIEGLQTRAKSVGGKFLARAGERAVHSVFEFPLETGRR